MKTSPTEGLTPVALAVEAVRAGRRRGDLHVVGIDLESGERLSIRFRSHGPWAPRPAHIMTDGLVLMISIEHPLPAL